MSLYTVSGIIIRRYPLGEADTIVHILSKERGKVEAVAKGARRIRSRLLAVTQPFILGEYLLFAGRSLERINQGEIECAYRRLREDLNLFALCTFCCELVDKVVQVGEPAPKVFYLTKGLLDYLHSDQPERLHLENALTYYLIKLLDALGYQVDFSSCLLCGAKTGLTAFSIVEGGPLCSSCSSNDLNSLRFQPAVFCSLDKLSSLGWAKLGIIKLGPYQSEIEKLLETFYHYHLEVETRSAAFWKSIRS